MYHSAIGLYAELQTASANLLGVGLDIIAGPIGMACGKAEAFARNIAASDMEGDQHRSEAFYIIVHAAFKLPLPALFKLNKALFFKQSHGLIGAVIG